MGKAAASGGRRRRLRRLSLGLGLASVFSAAAVGSLLLHVRFALGRRVAASTVTAVLGRTFSGRVVIEKIETIDADGVDGVEASVYDPEGERVLHVTGLRARASLAGIAATIAKGGDIQIVVPRARVEHADVMLFPDANGVPSIARAFLPRPSPAGARRSAPPKVSVWLPDIEMRSARGKGTVLGIPDLEVDLANVRGSVLAGTERSSIKVNRYSMNAVSPFRVDGTAETRIEVPSASGRNVSVWSAFDGYLGDVQVDARGSLDGKELDLNADIVRAHPAAVRALVPDWPMQTEVSAHVEAVGTPPLLKTQGHAEAGDGAVDFAGDLRIEHGVSIELGVGARAIDLRSFIASSPPTAVSAKGRLALATRPEGGVAGSFEAKTEQLRIEGFDVPPASVTGKVEGARVSGSAEIRDRALSSDVEFDIHPPPAVGPLVFDLAWSARAPELAKVAWLAPMGSGQARWQAKGQIAGGKIDARVDADVVRFERSGLRIDHAHVSGSMRGPLDAPVVSASLDGQGLVAGPLAFPEVSASARGPLGRLTLGATLTGADAPRLSVGATLARSAGRVSLHDLEVTAQREDVIITGKVQAIEISDDKIDLHEVTVTGAGATVTGSVAISESELRVRASAADLDLKKIAAVVAPKMRVGGRLTFDVDADLAGKNERGHVRLSLTDGTFAGFSGISAHAEADATGRRFSGGADLQLGELGAITARTVDAGLAGPLLAASSWTGASGRLEMDAQVDLDRLNQSGAAWLVPTVAAGGRVFGKVLLSRDEAEARAKRASGPSMPNAEVLVWTDGLKTAVREGTSLTGVVKPRFSSEGVDVQAGLHFEGESNHAELTTRLIDDGGILVGVTAIGDLPVLDLWRNRAKLGQRLLDLPVTAKLTLPRRALDKYPDAARLGGLEGEIEATGALSGSLRAPSVVLAVRGYKIVPTDELAFPVDVDAQATYDGKKAVTRVRATRPEGVVLDARADVDAPLAAWLPGAKGRPSWEASGSASLVRFPLGGVSFSGGQIGGLASGTVSFRGINRDPEVDAKIDFTDLKVDRALFPRGVVVMKLAKGGVVVSSNLEQTSGGGSATATARVKWTSPVLPELDATQPLDVYFVAHDLRAAALYPPLLRGIFTYFDGRLNGTLHLHQEVAKGATGQVVDGNFELSDGVFQIPAVGQEFRNATAKISMSQRGEVKISDVSANGMSGKLTASGTMMLKGLSFVSAEGEARIAEKEAVPLTLEGVSLGEAWGTLFLHAKKSDERTVKLDVDVPVLHTELPASSSRAVQEMGDRPDVAVGVRSARGELAQLLLGRPEEKRSDEALAWHMTFFLGQDVRIRRGPMLEIVLGGQPVVDLTDETRVSGQVDFRSGSVEVFGKKFELERGFAEFQGHEASNPFVSVTGRWDAPDGTRVFVDFVGPLKTGKLTPRSEPAHTASEIYAILLYGADDTASPGRPAAQQTDTTGSAGAVIAGGAVSTGVNQVLSSVSPAITTRVTNDAQNPTPEVAVQLSPKLSAEISYRTRKPRFGENPDRALVTLDWRFRRNWSVQTTVGQQSSVVDLIWQYRY